MFTRFIELANLYKKSFEDYFVLILKQKVVVY